MQILIQASTVVMVLVKSLEGGEMLIDCSRVFKLVTNLKYCLKIRLS